MFISPRSSVFARFGATVCILLATRGLSAQPVPGLLVERAIKVAGGAPALAQTDRITWDGEAVVHAGERIVRITGTWRMALPDSASVATRPVGTTLDATRILVMRGPTGWLVRDTVATPMPAPMLASEHDEFWGYHLMRLVTLRDTTLALRLIPGDSVEWKGIEVRAPGRPTALLQFDERARLRVLTMDVRDAAGQGTHRQRFVLGGEQHIVTSDGTARWYDTIDIVQDGAPYFALTLRNARLLPRGELP